MANDIEQTQTLDTKAIWIKGLYILALLVAGYIAVFVTFFIVIFQFIMELIFKEPNDHLQNFGDSLGIYACAVIRYITGATEDKPFPFKAWPKGSHEKR